MNVLMEFNQIKGLKIAPVSIHNRLPPGVQYPDSHKVFIKFISARIETDKLLTSELGNRFDYVADIKFTTSFY